MNMRLLNFVFIVLCFVSAGAVHAADTPQLTIPDLTKGGKLERRNPFSVGLLGINCGIWRARQGSDEDPKVRQFMVEIVDKGSPADGILAKDDVILGADGTGAQTVPLFAQRPQNAMADAINEAEARNPALLKLLLWRKGKTETVTIKLEALGRYSDTAPYNCEKSKRILRNGIKALYESNKPDKVGFGMLCLLAADDPTNPENDKVQARAKEWAHKIEVGGGPWLSGPTLMALSEYYMKTKDKTIFPKLVEAAERHANGVSWFGTTGHGWCEKVPKQPDGSNNGRIPGYGPINASGVLGFLGLSLARKAGVKSPAVDAAIERQRIFFGHHAFRSDIQYGEHPYGLVAGVGDYNGRNAMTGLALGLQEGQEEKAKYFCRMTALSKVAMRESVHGGSYFGQVFHPIGAAQGGVKSANLHFKEIRQHLDMNRRWDSTRIYNPTKSTPYTDFSHAATALIFYAMPLKQLYITGRGQKESLQLSNAEFNELVATKVFIDNPSKATTQELIAALSRSQGLLRNAATGELASRMKTTPDAKEWPAVMNQLLALASDSKAGPMGHVGACQALLSIREKNSTATGNMKNAEWAKTAVALLKAPDAYVNFGGIKVLQSLPPDVVMPYLNELLDAAIRMDRPTFPLNEDDPCRWAHTEMGVLLFGGATKERPTGGLLSKSIDGVDRKKLFSAIRSLLKASRGAGVIAASNVLTKLTKEEMLEIADAIVDTCKYTPPADAMFSKGSNLGAIGALAQYNFEEALPLSKGSEAVHKKILNKYGKSILTVSSGSDLIQAIADRTLVGAADGDFNGQIKELLKGEGLEMIKLKSIRSVKAAQPTLTLPASKTELVVDATNYARRGENETTYTWRKVYGAGKVDFSPNATAKSSKTTVSFTDQKPGKYRFEVAMSDTLGYNVVRQAVDVTLNDKSGKLPPNRPPVANQLMLNGAPGIPLPIPFSGTDPDGAELGFVVTSNPTHGKLNGVVPNLTYTADSGYNGEDSFKFDAIDGQGVPASGTVRVTVSDRNVGVAVYEGFDYPAGPVNGREGGTSFGFSGPWTVARNDTGYVVAPESFSSAALPSTGGRLTKGHFHKICSRALDPMVMVRHKLFDPGQELWFSVVIGFEKPSYSNFRMWFGLSGGTNSLGFHIGEGNLVAAKNGNAAGTSRVGWGGKKGEIKFPPQVPHTIMGRCIWGKTDADSDTLEIYRVFDAPGMGPMLLKEPVCVMQEKIDQSKLTSVYIQGTPGFLDEIRIGPTYQSVLLGTKPMTPTVGTKPLTSAVGKKTMKETK